MSNGTQFDPVAAAALSAVNATNRTLRQVQRDAGTPEIPGQKQVTKTARSGVNTLASVSPLNAIAGDGSPSPPGLEDAPAPSLPGMQDASVPSPQDFLPDQAAANLPDPQDFLPTQVAQTVPSPQEIISGGNQARSSRSPSGGSGGSGGSSGSTGGKTKSMCGTKDARASRDTNR